MARDTFLPDVPDDQIPPLLRPDQMPPVTTDADLLRFWRSLMGPLGFGARLLWIALLDDRGRVDPSITQVEDLPEVPDHRWLNGLLDTCGAMLAGATGGTGGSAAVLLSRPGGASLTPADLSWARGLLLASVRAGVRLRALHLACDESVRVFAGDDLVASRSA